MKNRKLVAGVIAATLSVSLMAGCGANNEQVPTGDAQMPENYNETSATVYEQQLGTFQDTYQAAKDELIDIDRRYALSAIAEAKLLESGVFIPFNSKGGGYAITRNAYHTASSVMWGIGTDRYENMVVAKEYVKPEDWAAMKTKWNELHGTGTYEEWVKGYMKDQGYTLNDEYALSIYNSEIKTWDGLATSRQADTRAIENTIDCLMQYDMENVLQPALAESYDISSDGTVYTFHLRDGLEWDDSQGRKIADLVADDFVAGMQHMMDAMGGLEFLVDGTIKGVHEYINGQASDMSGVGVRAVDDKTVEYTLEQPTPWFLTMLQYNPFTPLCRSFYESQGGKFGADYDNSAADYKYGTSPDSIAYCGPYLCTNYTPGNMIVFDANPNYWAADRINIHKITWPYEDGSDPLKIYNDMKAGILPGAGMTPSAMEKAKTDMVDETGKSMFDSYVHQSDTDGTSFVGFFNLNRVTYANASDLTKVRSEKTVDDAERSRKALDNANFRLALIFATDRAARQAQRAGEDLKYTALINGYTPGAFCSISNDTTVDINGTPTTFKAGTYYGEMVQAQITADGFPIKCWDADTQSSAGFDGWYNADNAKAYLDKAKSELDIKIDKNHPIKIDLPYSASGETFTNMANAWKQSVEAATDGQIIINLVACASDEEYYNTGYYCDYGYEGNYDINDTSGWSADYGDPTSFLDTLLPEGAGYMAKMLGIY